MVEQRWISFKKIERLPKKNLRIVFRKKPSDSIFDTIFEFKILTICELYIKHLLSFSLKSYFGLHSNKMMNEILTANQNFSYNTRSKTTRIIQTKTSKRISTRTSLGYRMLTLAYKIFSAFSDKPRRFSLKLYNIKNHCGKIMVYVVSTARIIIRHKLNPCEKFCNWIVLIRTS